MGTLEEGSASIDECKDICPPGTWSSTGLAPCTDCEFDSYRASSRSTLCDDCPVGTATLQQGSDTLLQCLDICQPGTFSATGLEEEEAPCTNCPLNFYQSLSRATECLPCPTGTITLQEASQSQNQCSQYCHPGSSSPTGLATCTLCQRNFYQPNSGATVCLPCPSYTATDQEGATFV
ncbi:signal peptide, CUB and EGF-like domain-containing protein 2 [Amphiura filiformis]|uniref:signal peptide, CUB and EGF-like domain-containing protein 2 n=1 Tax=Amphiura filiformis TaxID=82378 RepID=UPI003B221282